MKVNKPKAHKQASHCVKWIPDVFFLNYIVTTTARSTYSNTLYGYSSYGKIFPILTFKFPIKPSWTWGVGDTVRVHPEMRAATDWLSTDSLDVTLACDDQPRCLSWSEGLSLVVLWHGEMLGSYGHFQSLSHCAYWSEASYWFSSTQSSLDKFQARMMPCSIALRMFKEMKRMIFGGSS